MKLPKKIKVLSRDYTVRPQTSFEEGKDDVFGKCDREIAEIVICSSVPGQKQAQTLFHELIHAIIMETGIYKHFYEERKITEEDVATCVSIGISTVMRDNPRLMPAIQKGLK